MPCQPRAPRDTLKNTLEILHGLKSTLKPPILKITLAAREQPLGLKITLTDHSSTTISVLLPDRFGYLNVPLRAREPQATAAMVGRWQ